MFRCAKPFGQALRPEPAGVPPAAYGGSTAGGCTPRPRGGLRPPPRPGRPAAAPLPTADQWEGGMGASPHVSAQCYPCPMLRRSVSRSRSTPRSHDAWHGGTTPHAPLRALLNRYLAACWPHRAPAGATRCRRHRLGGPAPLVGVGICKAKGRAGPPQDGPKLGGLFAPLGGAGVYWLFIFCVVEDVRRKKPQTRMNPKQYLSDPAR